MLSRQREFKLAAIHAKQSGNIEQAKQHYLIAKVTVLGCLFMSASVFLYMLLNVTPNICDMQSMDSLVEALDRGEPVDLCSLPPPPGEFSGTLLLLQCVVSLLWCGSGADRFQL